MTRPHHALRLHYSAKFPLHSLFATALALAVASIEDELSGQFRYEHELILSDLRVSDNIDFSLHGDCLLSGQDVLLHKKR